MIGHDPENPCRVEFDGKSITLDGYYEIPLSRIPDPRALCEWIHHISGKGWVTADGIQEIVEIAFEAKGWQLYTGV